MHVCVNVYECVHLCALSSTWLVMGNLQMCSTNYSCEFGVLFEAQGIICWCHLTHANLIPLQRTCIHLREDQQMHIEQGKLRRRNQEMCGNWELGVLG